MSMDNAQELRERILLLMKYSLSETLSENKKKLNEQSVAGAPNYGMTNNDSPQTEVDNKKKDYPNYCKYPDKAVIPSENEHGLKGKDAIPEGMCCYLTPLPFCKTCEDDIEPTRLAGTQMTLHVAKKKVRYGYSYIAVPPDTTINFVESLESYSDILDIVWKNFTAEEQKLIKKEAFVRELMAIIPKNTVTKFTIGRTTYIGYICYTNIIYQDIPNCMSWGWYKDNNNENYEPPVKFDTRSDYRKFVDDWGTVLQWTAVIVTAIAGIACEGCTWPLAAEIITELGLGIMVGWREFEKGEDVSAAVSFITGMLPILKTFKTLRGIKPGSLENISEVFGEANLTVNSPASDYVLAYNRLSEDGKLAFNQMMRSDEITKARFMGKTSQELGDDVAESSFDILRAEFKADPQLMRKIPLGKRLWARELGANFSVAAAGIIVNMVWGDKLNYKDSKKLTDEMKDKLDGIYTHIPEKLKNEWAENIMGNMLSSEAYLDDPETKKMVENAKKYESQNMENGLNIYWKSRNAHLIEKNEGVYKESPETSDVPLIDEQEINENELQKMLDRGWVNIFELGRDINETDSIANFNGDIYVKKNNQKK